MIDQPDQLADLIDRLHGVERYAIDTEFHRERTYWPKLALIQLAWQGNVELIDPFAVDVAPLAELLASDAVAIAHAADQDLEVLDRACGRGPAKLFDTQLAAGFLGFSSPSLTSLAEKLLEIRLPKGDRLTDWSRRPLTDAQLEYAAADVLHLEALADRVCEQLEQRGRRAWAEQECDAVIQRPRGPVDPDVAWWRLRDSRQLRGPSRGVAQEVAGWRERRAMTVDVPPRFVLADLALLSIAHKPPRSRNELFEVRGIDSRHLRGSLADELLAAIERGRKLDGEQLRLPPVDEVDRDRRPAVALAAAWVAQLARDEHIDAALLATRSDLVALLRGDADARLATGWRAELVGIPVGRLVNGEAALAFNGHGGLVLEERSNQPFRS
jgi:ribonuclease D